ncbi:flippase [Halovivax cerinus]|uniref:Flippase n=1 Tax=Halovivax cerinus TaxID=1487865 RepID=A0ABD5NR76_9EURY|nr:flippase [Halovivax cerinus]
MTAGAEYLRRFRSALLAEAINVGAAVVLTVGLARLMDPDSYGVLFLALSVLGVAQLLSAFGVSKSAGRYIAEYRETDPAQLPHILRSAFTFNAATILAVSIVLLVVRDDLARAIGEPALEPLLLVGIAFVVGQTLVTFCKQTIQGFEDIGVSSRLVAANKVGRLVGALGLVALGYEALGALVGYVASSLAVSAVGLAYLYIRKIRTAPDEPIESGLRRRLARYSAPIAVNQTAHSLDNYIDTIVVGAMLGPAAVSYYTIGFQLARFLGAPMTALGFTLSPAFGSQKAAGRPDRAARLYETALTKGLLVYVPAAAGVVLLAEPGVEYVFGADYRGAVPVLQVMAAFVVIRTVQTLSSDGLDYLGRARTRAVIKLTTAVANVCLTVVLVSEMGVVGAAIATVATSSCYAGVTCYLMHRELALRLRWLGRRIGEILAITALMSVVVWAIAPFVTGIVTLAAVVAAGVAVWGLAGLYAGTLDVALVRRTLS